MHLVLYRHLVPMSSVASQTANLVQRVQQGLSKLEIVYATHDRWPLPTRTGVDPAVIRVAVLDSSFNPPTRAHLALVNTHILSRPAASDLDGAHDYNARLLLLSVRNADKTLKSTDATYIQRLEMMMRLESNVVSDQSAYAKSDRPNFAVAIVDEPTFVGKASVLLDFLHHRLSSCLSPQPSPMLVMPGPQVQLTFLMGFDTLERLFAARYYQSEQVMEKSLEEFFSPNHHDCRVLCARRVTQGLRQAQEAEEGERRTMVAARQLMEAGRVALVNIGESEQTMSSSDVRQMRLRGDDEWKMLVTDAVANYVLDQGLYRSA